VEFGFFKLLFCLDDGLFNFEQLFLQRQIVDFDVLSSAVVLLVLEAFLLQVLFQTRYL
jgi:hypothetical protein